MDALVSSTDGFSPADIEYAAQKASQGALERALSSDAGVDGAAGPSSSDYLDAVADTRATVSREVADAFLEDIELIARV